MAMPLRGPGKRLLPTEGQRRPAQAPAAPLLAAGRRLDGRWERGRPCRVQQPEQAPARPPAQGRRCHWPAGRHPASVYRLTCKTPCVCKLPGTMWNPGPMCYKLSIGYCTLLNQ